jgi:CheY-like chemotaxis protein
LSRLLLEEPLDEKTNRQGLETIRRNALLQVRLIEDILDTTRVISGKLHLDLRSIEFGDVVRAAFAGIKMPAAAKQQRIELLLDGESFRVLGDPERLQQAVGNLLNNAVKFTPLRGGIRVELMGAPTEWQLVVTDTGKGIAPEFLPRLFDRFGQQDGTASRRYSGLGLGLALVKHIVDAHGGTVGAHSEGDDRGAVFTLTLPREDTPQSRRRGSLAPSLSEPPSMASVAKLLSALKILIVEDDEDARELLVTVLVRQGANVQSAATSESALEMIANATPDVLLSDIGLPDHDGYELVRLVRARGYSVKELPAIALTAYARAEDRKLALDAGFQAYVAKPVDLVTLVKVVARVVGRAAAE